MARRKIRPFDFKKVLSVNWRLTWYGVMVWITAFLAGGFIILPWFYFVFPGLILLITVVYFRNYKFKKLSLNESIQIQFAQGLYAGFFWFCAVFLLDLFQLFSFNDFSFSVFFLDPRNFIKYPVIILIPAIYGLIVENGEAKKKAKLSFRKFVSGIFGLTDR